MKPQTPSTPTPAWPSMSPLLFDPKCRQTQTAMLLTTEAGTSVARGADTDQLDLFADAD